MKNPVEGEKKAINSELWHACAGPLVSLPPAGSLVVYFPQGHSEQVASSMQKDTTSIPNSPPLPPKLVCVLQNVMLHADADTDEVYARMTLQPVHKYDNEALLVSEMGLKQNNQPIYFFCKTLTASEASTHGGLSVPRLAAEKMFPPLDFQMQLPTQELTAKDLHDVSWTFRHIFRGQPKRHLLTSGWSVFVTSKRLLAGDSVLFIRDDKSRLHLGIRRSIKQQPALSSSVLSSDSMHIGILASAAHAAASNSPFTIFYHPRASSSEFIIPSAKYNKAMYSQVSLGMRFRMMFETEESGVRRYMGTIIRISDLDPVWWKNSQWRNLQVGWDESAAAERRARVSMWEIEPMASPFDICPPPFFRSKFLKQPEMPDAEPEFESAFKRAMPWLGDNFGSKKFRSSTLSGLSLVQWMAMQQNPQLIASAAQSYFPSMAASVVQDQLGMDETSRILNFQPHALPFPNLQNSHKLNPNIQQLNQYQQPPLEAPQQQQQPQLSKQNSIHVHQQQQQQPQLSKQNSIHVHQQQEQPLQPQQGCVLLQQQLLHPQQGSVLLQQQPPPFTQPQQDSMLQQPSQQQQGPIHQHQQKQGSSCLLQQQPNRQHQDQLLQQKQLHQHKLRPVFNRETIVQKEQKEQAFAISPSAQNQLLNQPVQQQQQLSSTGCPTPQLRQFQHLPTDHVTNHYKTRLLVRSHSTPREKDSPLCSSCSSTNTYVSASRLLNSSQHRTAGLADGLFVPPADNLLQELQSKPYGEVKHELDVIKNSDQLPDQQGIADQSDASSATSFSLVGNIQENFSLHHVCLDGDIQADTRNDFLIRANINSLIPNTQLSRDFGSGKDIEQSFSSYGNQKDVETEVSTAAINSQSFGFPDMVFKPGYSSGAVATESKLSNRGLWVNQSQRLRTYTKVQKCGSVGRSIDITRYSGYDELRRDLASLFGIVGQLEDPYRTDWKLVYVDHENDVLLVGDDPWEEFVNCVKRIKILSAAEVQQISLDGGLANIPTHYKASSSSDDGYVWWG